MQAGNEKLRMFSRLLCHGIGVKSCSLSQIPFPRYFLQTIVSFKPTLTLTRASHLTRDAQFFPLSKIRVTNLRSRVCEQNRAILAKRNPNSFASVSPKETTTVNMNTNVLNSVFLYKYERPKYFLYMNGFGALQLFFWIGISYVMFTLLPARDPKQGPLTTYLHDNFITILVSTIALLVGIGSALLIWVFTAKSVRYLILHKGGKDVTFITYHPLNKNVITTVPIDSLNCRTARKEMKNYLPVKLKGHWFNYILDSGGEFVNPTLFDNTVGAMR